ncbi:MAG TPA: polysaccharide lyase family protein [Opitutales bacterium]|jgi:rhamnogalacturonan endolyase|nr:polysaccharide lyase family protein [Opitutales bacterium]
MKTCFITGTRQALTLTALAAALAAPTLSAAPAIEKSTVSTPVTITDSGNNWTLDNGIVKATIGKRDGRMTALVYHGINTMGSSGGGYWEQNPSGQITQTVTIDPATNGGARAEVAVKGVTGGRGFDMEFRYDLERGASGIYVYGIYNHPASYAAASEGESRYITKLNKDYFNWISVDADRNMLECTPKDWGAGVVVHAKEQRILNQGVYLNSVEHKYSYNAVQFKIPAYGWSSTQAHIGVWFINPTTEYLSGGASKLELVAHFDANDDPDPIILDYWCAGHYGGGAGCNVPAGEEWNHVVGPIFVYCNALANPQDPSQADLDKLAATAGNPTVPAVWKDNATALYQDALAQAKKQTAQWPYEWVNGVDYPHKDQRGNVSGQFVLTDPLLPKNASTKLPHLTVGLAHPEYTSGAGGFVNRAGNGNVITWDHDGNYYQFWTNGTEDGKFDITNVRPGNYTLHAFADGVLGEFAQANITVEAGKNIDLGQLKWTPVRYGTQVWDIGYPDRTGGKFFKGDGANYWLWGWNMRYALLFPNDITYTIGKSDYHQDWFFEEVPHATSTDWINPAAKDPANQRFGWVKALPTGSPDPWRQWGQGRATTWTIKFNMDKSPQGYAAFRVALAGADGGRPLAVSVNGKSVGAIGGGGGTNLNSVNSPIMATNAIRYNTDTGVWQQRTLTFDASVLKSGENTMTLTYPGGDLESGVVWDYLRLELNEAYKLDGTPIK